MSAIWRSLLAGTTLGIGVSLLSSIALAQGSGGGGASAGGGNHPPEERPERIEAANPVTSDAERGGEFAARRLRVLPGVQSDGRVLLPNQWSLRPVGDQLELGDFPVNIAMHPSEAYCAVLHAGHGAHEIAIVEIKTRRIVSRVTLSQTFYGLSFDHAGKRLFASGAEEDLVHVFEFADGFLSKPGQIQIVEPKSDFVVTGVSTTRNDAMLLTCGGWGGKLAVTPISGDVSTSAAGTKIIDLGFGSYPYAALEGNLAAEGIEAGGASGANKTAAPVYVSLWGGSAVAVVDIESGSIKAKWTTQSHPTEMALSPDGKTLFVACSNSTQVSVIDTSTGRARETISCALYPNVPSGNTPNSLSLSADGAVLAVANADNNTLSLFNVEKPGQARSLGFVPTGWYPTSVRFLSNGGLIYASGKGLMSKANRNGPNPLVSPPGGLREYIGGLFRGTLGFVKPLKPEDLTKYTKTAFETSPLHEGSAVNIKTRDADNPIPAKLGDPSPIKHCIYIIKENRTYDQVFGDMPEGNGDPNLCIFPERVTPNLHALAREFVLLDNFYVESEVSADGHEWSMGAYATDFVEKTWPMTYRSWRPKEREIGYPSEGAHEIAIPAGGYLWDRCKEAGVSYRSYGEWVENGKTPSDPGIARSAALEGHIDPWYHSYDLEYPDVKRAERFLSELKRFEADGGMPALSIVRLPNDHTYGSRRGKPTPTAMVAENDLAVGMLVDGVSRSKFWATTAIFIIEDDAQNGSDHVDAHRTTALVISPYTKRRHVDSSMYSTASMLRTMELILGVQPMSQFDAAALPMYASFTATPNLTPYTFRPANVDVKELTRADAWGVELSDTFDLAREDAADDLLLNEVIWRSVRGADSPMPAPVRAAFVFASAKPHHDDDDDDDHDDK